MSRIIGAHSMIHSANPDADRDFLRDVLKLTNVDAGGGLLIFGLPPAEVHVHPSDRNDVHELYLMCDDVEAFIEEMKKNNVGCGPIQDQVGGTHAVNAARWRQVRRVSAAARETCRQIPTSGCSWPTKVARLIA
jgi:hypothetical protein